MEFIAVKCPFLTRVPTKFLQKAGNSLLSYAKSCPVMTEYMGRYATFLTLQNIR